MKYNHPFQRNIPLLRIDDREFRAGTMKGAGALSLAARIGSAAILAALTDDIYAGSEVEIDFDEDIVGLLTQPPAK